MTVTRAQAQAWAAMAERCPAGSWITNEAYFGKKDNPDAVLTTDKDGLLMSGSGGARSWFQEVCRSSGVDASPEIMRHIAASREAVPALAEQLERAMEALRAITEAGGMADEIAAARALVEEYDAS